MGNHQSNPHPIKRRTHPQKTPPPSSASSPSSPSSTSSPQNPSLPPLKNQAFLPNRASYYIPRSETEKLPNSPINRKASDTHFPIDPPRKPNTRIQRKPPSKPSTKIVTSDQKARDFQGFELPPILTKPTKIEPEPTARRSPVGLHRLRLRASSPRLQSKKLESFRARRSSGSKKQRNPGLSASFAVVKSSSDPKRDFRDSMIEMIVEHKIRASKDLEELLACYLALNSDEYHGVIVKVFEQIWFELTESPRL